ncbi:MAG: glycosyltransferase family 2 protein [Chitinophagales bacterium]
MKKIAVVVLCWNGRKFMEEFLPTLLQFQSDDSEIIVADNASADDSVEYVKKNFPSVKVIQLEKNFGFARGYNEAIKTVTAEYIVLLNQDVAVSANWLQPLVQMIESDATIAAVQPCIRGHLQRTHFEYAGAAGGWIDRYGYTFCRGRIFDVVEEDQDQYNTAAEIFWASGACMMVRRKIYEEMGGLDADFFAHMEEIDLCWRMKNAGYKIMYCPCSQVYHLGGGSLPQGNPFKTYLNYRNNLIMMAKNLPQHQVRGIVRMRLLLDGISAIRSILRGYPKDFTSIRKAHGDFKRGAKKWKSRRRGNEKDFFSLSGVYPRSIVNDFFFKGRKRFSDLFR